MGAGNGRQGAHRLQAPRLRLDVVLEFAVGSGSEIVAMVQTAEPRHGNDLRTCCRSHCYVPFCRSFLIQPEMGSFVVVIADVLGHEALQVTLVQDDYMVEQVAAAIADEAFGDAVLPGTLKAGSFGFDAETLDGVDDFLAEICCSIEDQIARRGIVREGFAQLLNHPGGSRVLCRIEMQYAPPIVRDDEEAVEDVEG